MSKYKVTVAYDGSSYYGWQSQKDVVNIQDTIEKALSVIHKEPVRIIASGRTDRNVHAYGQVFHFETTLFLTAQQWIKAMNSNLPYDIRILDVQPVNEDFHARYDVIKKRYDYYLNSGEYNLFERNYVTQLGYTLDIDSMKEATGIFIGTHDFSSFCGNSFEETPNQVRTIEKLEIVEENNKIHFIFEGDGFLRYMVRMIVGTLIEVGKGKLSLQEVKDILEAKSKDVCRFKAPAEGLYLTEVYYK